MKHYFYIVILATVLATVLATFAVAAHAQAAPSDKVSTALHHQAEMKGPVQVLVVLDTDTQIADTYRQKDAAKLAATPAAKTQKGSRTRLKNFDKHLAIKEASRSLMQRLPANLSNVRQFNHFPLLRAEVDAAGLRALEASPEVIRVVEDRRHRPSLAQSVPLVEADATQTLGFRGQGQAVAILDTGVDANHPFLSPRVVEEACFSSNSGSTTTVCPNGQETQLGAGACCTMQR